MAKYPCRKDYPRCYPFQPPALESEVRFVLVVHVLDPAAVACHHHYFAGSFVLVFGEYANAVCCPVPGFAFGLSVADENFQIVIVLAFVRMVVGLGVSFAGYHAHVHAHAHDGYDACDGYQHDVRFELS